MISRNGVVASSRVHYDGTYLIASGGTRRLANTGRTIENLLWIAHTHDLDALYILPGSIESFSAGCGKGDLYYDSVTTSTETITVHPHTEDNRVTCIHAWYTTGERDRRRTIRVFYPEHDERWGLQNITNPNLLLSTVDLVENALGTFLDWSPGSTGKRKLLSLNAGPRASWLAPVDFTGTPWLPTEEQQAEGVNVPLSSSGARKQFPDLKALDTTEPMYFHAYDKAYGFGGAMTGASAGEGAPSHVAGQLTAWNGKLPGVWRTAGSRWLYTPEMDYLLKEGYVDLSQIEEGWCWHVYHETMKTFAHAFWDIDVALARHPLAQAVAKKIRSITFGWLAMDTRLWHETPDEDDTRALDFYRPDIWGMVVSTSRTNMNYKMNQLWRRGHDARWWNCDELGFFSNDPDPIRAVPIVDRVGIGAFCWRYTLKVDDDLLFSFDPAVPFADTHALLLKKWHEQQQHVMENTLLLPSMVVRAHV